MNGAPLDGGFPDVSDLPLRDGLAALAPFALSGPLYWFRQWAKAGLTVRRDAQADAGEELVLVMTARRITNTSTEAKDGRSRKGQGAGIYAARK